MGRVIKQLKSFKGRTVKYIMFKIMFPLWYKLNSQKEIKNEKIVFVEIRLPRISNSFQVIYEKLQSEYDFEIKECYLRNGFVSYREYLFNSMKMIKEIADAKYIFVNEASNVLSSCPIRKETKVVQLWHGCGAFKKFGFSTADLIFGDDRKNQLKYPFHKNYYLVTVSSPEVIWAYAEAMLLEDKKEIIKPLGISRTDIFFKKETFEKAKERLNTLIPESVGKKVILYAPTFRGRVANAQPPTALNISMLGEKLSEECILLIKHHQLVKKLPSIPEEWKGFAFDVTKK